MKTYKKKHYSAEQRVWCERYERETMFEPLMCDYEAGHESFFEAARRSIDWFESWSSDAHLRIGRDVPGAMEALMASLDAKPLTPNLKWTAVLQGFAAPR